MDQLRKVDDSYRSVLSCKEIIDNDSGGLLELAYPLPEVSLKENLKQIKDSFKQRDISSFFKYLEKFHNTCKLATSCLEHFSYDFNALKKIIFSQDLNIELISLIKKSQKSLALYNQNVLIKNAFFDIFLSDKQKTFKNLSKRFPKFFKEFVSTSKAIIEKSENILRILMTASKNLATFRAKREIESYFLESQKIINQFKSYNNFFNSYYSKYDSYFEKKEEESKAPEKSTDLLEPISISPISSPTTSIINDTSSQPQMPKLVDNDTKAKDIDDTSDEPEIKTQDLSLFKDELLNSISEKTNEIIEGIRGQLLIDDNLMKMILPIVETSVKSSISNINNNIDIINKQLNSNKAPSINSSVLEKIIEEKLNNVIAPQLQKFIMQQLSNQVTPDQATAIKENIVVTIEQTVDDKIEDLSQQPEVKTEDIVLVEKDFKTEATNLFKEKIKEYLNKELNDNQLILFLNIIEKSFNDINSFSDFINSDQFKEAINNPENKSIKSKLDASIKKYNEALNPKKEEDIPPKAQTPVEQKPSPIVPSSNLTSKYSSKELNELKQIVSLFNNMTSASIHENIVSSNAELILKEILETDDLFNKIKQDLPANLIQELSKDFDKPHEKFKFIRNIISFIQKILKK